MQSRHRIEQVDQPLQNVRRTTTSGFEFAVSDDAKLGAIGRVHTAYDFIGRVVYMRLSQQF